MNIKYLTDKSRTPLLDTIFGGLQVVVSSFISSSLVNTELDESVEFSSDDIVLNLDKTGS